MSAAEIDAERLMMSTLANLLDQGRVIDGTSRLITAAAMISLLLLPLTTGLSFGLPTAITMAVAAVGLGETYFAFRVGFDAALFRGLAGRPSGPDLAELDGALRGLGLIPDAKTGRPLAERATGARSLLYTQGTLLAAQAVLILIDGALVGVGLAR